METVVDLYDLTTFRLADGSERNDDAASIMQMKVMSKHCLNISTAKDGVVSHAAKHRTYRSTLHSVAEKERQHAFESVIMTAKRRPGPGTSLRTIYIYWPTEIWIKVLKQFIDAEINRKTRSQ